MKDNTVYLENNPPLSYKMGRGKGSLALCFLVVVAAYLVFLVGVLEWRHPLLYTLLPAWFLLAGCLYLFLLNKNLSGLRTGERWLVSGASCGAVLALLAGSAFWIEQLSRQSLFAAAGAFLLPFTLAELWQVYADLSFSGIKPWQAANEEPRDLPTSFLHAMKVRFKVIQEPDVSGSGVIPVLASGRMKLSDVFFDMVRKQNKKGQPSIALASREREPHTWVFYKKDMLLWYRTLDPGKTLLDNGIGKNALIYVQRVSQNTFTQPSAGEQTIFES